jgi:hypothetical protein
METLLILSLLFVASRSIITSYQDVFQSFKWKKPYDYYYRSVQEKLPVILHGNCLKNVNLLPVDANITVPTERNRLNVITYSIDKDLYLWWIRIPKPRQMRIDPRICTSIYLKRKPIFDNPGCQLDGYMSPSAPRCQTKYLKYICENSKMNFTDVVPNHFVIVEADHSQWLTPPSPWIAVAKNASVSICGHISASCGKRTSVSFFPFYYNLFVFRSTSFKCELQSTHVCTTITRIQKQMFT